MTTPDHPLTVHAYPTLDEMGAAAARAAAPVLREAITRRGSARLMLAAAPSQSATLRALAADGLDFSAIDCFHMDDYIGLTRDAPQGFGNWLEHELFRLVTPRSFHRIDVAADPEQAASNYREAMGDEPFDVTLCGLGVNGHLAFNDPPADLEDPLTARVVELDQVSRWQQVDEGHFASVDEVPAHAITVTIPRLLHARRIVVSVPTAVKRQAVHDAVHQPISGSHPGTALRTHPDVHLFVDTEADPR
ncbi:6-phosphogluconolactonase [Brachybacterium sp. MASK1Z-5]|uniref:6-phosphogluconolactonase n=1 Tax=Brachybacterium halotolerans TaxID=2795215 RepID=A0ABS1BAC9_9MICO|nr:6-phosphogluconolactonase [Brachybacterium halotolerans]MBK0331568.1 6-phosphogluconolactonase [Brachybacterium halotolerans]